jgi:hypothetical protein
MAFWVLWAALWVDAKSSNFPLAVALVPLALRLGWWAETQAARNVAILGAALIGISAIWNMETRPAYLQNATTYDALFQAILPESKSPSADLISLGLDPQLERFSGTGAWSEGTAFSDTVRSGIIGGRITSATIARFYLVHPARIWKRAKTMLPVAFSLRPEFCGNFDRSAGRPPDARSNEFSLWSGFHQRFLARFGKWILILLLLAPIGSVAIWIRFPGQRLCIEFCAALYACCLISFLVPLLGDAWDNVKHFFLFNLLLDSILAAALASACRLGRGQLRWVGAARATKELT